MGFFIPLKNNQVLYYTMKHTLLLLAILFSVVKLNAQESQDTTSQKTDTTTAMSTADLKNKQDSIRKSMGLPPMPAVYPSFPGGQEEMHKFLYTHFVYPAEAKENGIQGRAYVTFMVMKDGSISNIKVVRGPGYGCNEEAIRLVKMMPTWTPGYDSEGNPLEVKYTLPISFKLAQPETEEDTENESKKHKKKKKDKKKKDK